MRSRALTRRVFVAATAGAAFGAPRTISYRPYARCLPDYLRSLALAAHQQRQASLAKLTTPAAIKARQQWVRRNFWQLIGGEPERTPLHVRTVRTLERPDYRVESLVYESQPGLVVTANLYVPAAGQGSYPGVLFQAGHSLQGKAYASYQKCCQGLAKLGYVVLAPDPMGQGERIYYPDGKGSSRLGSADDEHTYAGQQMLLTGQTATQLQLWDAVRSLDVLAGHPLVDPQRLASTGQSGGGTLTMFLAAVDDRLRTAVVACGNTENFACPSFNPPGATDDAEQNLLGAGPLGLDRWDLLYPLAPKPLLLLASARDFFGTYSPQYLENGRAEYARIAAVYRTLGHADRIDWRETALPHGLAHELRVAIYDWFGRHLRASPAPVKEEPAVAPEPDEALRVGATGDVVKDFASRTPFVLTRERAQTLVTPGVNAAQLRQLLAINQPAHQPAFTTLGTATAPHGLRVDAVEVPPVPHVWLPAWLVRPEGQDTGKPVILLLEPRGRNARWQEGALHQELAAQGCVVCAADLRGSGDLSPEVGRGAAAYTQPHASEDNYAWASLILGRPLLGQRVADVLALVAALQTHEAARGRRIVIAALGHCTVPALIAAALASDVHTVSLHGGLCSYRALATAERYSHPLANFVPNLLAQFDLPQVAALVAPRRLILAGAVDAAGQAMPPAAVRNVYGPRVEVAAAPQWTVEHLRTL